MAKWKSPFVSHDDDDDGFTTPTPSGYNCSDNNPFTHIPQAPHHHKSLFVSHDDGSATPPPAWNYSNNPFTYIPQAPASSKKLLSKRIFLDLDEDDRHLLYAPDLMLFTSSPTRSSPTNDDDDDSDTTTTTNIKKVKTTHTSSFNKNNTSSSSSTLKFQASLLQLLHGKSLQQQFKNKRDGVMTEIEIGIQIGNGSGISAAAAAIVAAECDNDDDDDDDALLVGTLNISSSNINNNNNSTPQLLSSESLFKSGGGGGGGFPHSKEEEFSSTKIQRSSSGIVALGRVVQRRRSGIARGA